MKLNIVTIAATIILTLAYFPEQIFANEGGGGGQQEEVTQNPFSEAKGIKDFKKQLARVDSDIRAIKREMLDLQKRIKADEKYDRRYDKEIERQESHLKDTQRRLSERRQENKTGKTTKGKPLSNSARARNESYIPEDKDLISFYKSDLKSLASAQKQHRATIRKNKRKLKKLRQTHKNLQAKRGNIKHKISNF